MLLLFAAGVGLMLTGCPRPEPAPKPGAAQPQPAPPNVDVRARITATFDLELPAAVGEKNQLPVRCKGELQAVYDVTVIAGEATRCRYKGKLTLVAMRLAIGAKSNWRRKSWPGNSMVQRRMVLR